MNKYIVEVHQDAGCDYKIACGIRVYPVDALSFQEAVAKVSLLLLSDECSSEEDEHTSDWWGTGLRPPLYRRDDDPDQRIKKMIVYQVTKEVVVDVEEVHSRVEDTGLEFQISLMKHMCNRTVPVAYQPNGDSYWSVVGEEEP